MATAAQASGGVVAAHLGFLAIFNPSLGNTDETVEDQIVYYASVATQSASHKGRRRRRARGRPTDAVAPEERHERLRQIGLAQGMASFSRGFSGGAAVDAIETERSRVVMHELEPGWWMLASIDLTKTPLPPRLPAKAGERQEERFEYSTRDMKPAALLLRDLLRAHSIFLMHHGASLSALFVRFRRPKFVAVLTRYWDLFLSTWSVVLHGNPVRDVFGGINVAASGELGVGVGEEDRGSGEREVLEGLVGRIEGLVDLVVSRFGGDEDSPSDADKGERQMQHQQQQSWLGTGQDPAADDGVIFLGTGALSRKSLRDVTHWMEDLYTWGEHAYGVIDSPTSNRRARNAAMSADQASKPDVAGAATWAPPRGSGSGSGSAQQQPQQAAPKDYGDGAGKETRGSEDGKLDKMLSYMKLGYGSYWTFSGGGSRDTTPSSTQMQIGQEGSAPSTSTSHKSQPPVAARRPSAPRRASSAAAGHFLIGLRGEVEEAGEATSASPASSESDAEHNSRTVLRTLHVELESSAGGRRPEAAVVKDRTTQSQVLGNMLPGYGALDANKADKLRVVVYVNRPFVFAFLFRLRTDSLAWDAMYRSLHYQLAPLKKPLLASTSYRRAAAAGIYSLVWDPAAVTVHSTIPNIAEHAAAAAAADPWSRADAVNTHLHLLGIHAATRAAHAGDLERTQKTSRGWWLVWTRLVSSAGGCADGDDALHRLSTIHESASPPSPPGRSVDSREAADDDGGGGGGGDGNLPDVAKEIFLIRRASDHAGLRGAVGDGGGADGAGKLAQGIGVDTRRYVEELLSLL